MPKEGSENSVKDGKVWSEWLTKLRGDRGERRITRSMKESENGSPTKSRKPSLPNLKKRKGDTAHISDEPDMPKLNPTVADLPPAYDSYEEEATAIAKSKARGAEQYDRVRNGTKAAELYAQRQLLVDEELKSSWQAKARASASAVEKDAALIVYKVREHERYYHFGNLAGEALPEKDSRDMGGSFLMNKDRIDSSRLFEIAKKMPKGALLHLHMNAQLQPEELIRQARGVMDTFCITSNKALENAKAFDEAEVQFSVVRTEDITKDSALIFNPAYAQTLMQIPPGQQKTPQKRPKGFGAWVRWSDFAEAFNRSQYAKDNKFLEKAAELDNQTKATSKPETEKMSTTAAEYWARKKMILEKEEVYDPTQSVNGIWARFNQGTRAFKGFFNYELAYTWYLENAIDELMNDGIMYTEFRPMWLDKSIPNDKGEAPLGHRKQIEILQDVCKRKHAELRRSGRIDEFPFIPKIIYCAPRSLPKEMVQTEIEDCIALKKEFGDIICGFDLVGAEDRPNNIGFYLDQLYDMQERCSKIGISIPFMFHAGETLVDTGGSRDPGKSNLYDSVFLKAKRIGHGFSLLKHPGLVQKFKQENICIELCPISNELLHLCRSAKEHPYPAILEAGIPCTLNSDNPSLFRNSMSHEFYQVMVGSPTMTIHGWKQLALWSIEYSCLNKEQQTHAETIFLQKFEAFCQDIVNEAKNGNLSDIVQPKPKEMIGNDKKYYDAMLSDADIPSFLQKDRSWS